MSCSKMRSTRDDDDFLAKFVMDKNNDDDDDDDVETRARICVAMQHPRSSHPALPLQT